MLFCFFKNTNGKIGAQEDEPFTQGYLEKKIESRQLILHLAHFPAPLPSCLALRTNPPMEMDLTGELSDPPNSQSVAAHRD